MTTQYVHPRNGWSVRELAKQTGASPRSIINWTSEPREDYLQRAEQRRQQIRQLREQGLSMRAIAAEVGCSVGTVHNALKRHNDNQGSCTEHVETS